MLIAKFVMYSLSSLGFASYFANRSVAVICKVECIVNSFFILYEVDLEFIAFHGSKIELTKKGQ